MIIKNLIRMVGMYFLLVFIIMNMFIFNIFLHELGHYFAAYFLNLDPVIVYNIEGLKETGFNLNSISIASTRFFDDGNSKHLFFVVLMGPFVNLILGLIFLGGIFLLKKRLLKEICFGFFVVSFFSFVMNIIPVGKSDGSLILRIIFG